MFGILGAPSATMPRTWAMSASPCCGARRAAHARRPTAPRRWSAHMASSPPTPRPPQAPGTPLHGGPARIWKCSLHASVVCIFLRTECIRVQYDVVCAGTPWLVASHPPSCAHAHPQAASLDFVHACACQSAIQLADDPTPCERPRLTSRGARHRACREHSCGRLGMLRTHAAL